MLWLGVLDQAVNDWARTTNATRREAPHARRSAHAWFLSNSRWPGSFLFVCEIFDMDPAWFRKQLFEAPPDELRQRMDQRNRDKGKRIGVSAG